MGPEVKAEKPAPNIKFVGKPGEEIPYFNNAGEGRITLPKVEEQNKPFHHEKANLIAKLFPRRYKKVKSKG